MSCQVRFFLLPDDVLWLMDQLRRKIAIRILQDCSPTTTPIDLTSPLVTWPANSRFKAHTSVHCYLAQPSDTDVRLWYASERREWLIADTSEVIQFSGCRFDGESLAEGRFYFHTNQLIASEIVPMRPQFRSWAGSIFRRSKRILRYSPGLQAYVGPATAEWWRHGGRLVWDISGRPAYDGEIPGI